MKRDPAFLCHSRGSKISLGMKSSSSGTYTIVKGPKAARAAPLRSTYNRTTAWRRDPRKTVCCAKQGCCTGTGTITRPTRVTRAGTPTSAAQHQGTQHRASREIPWPSRSPRSHQDMPRAISWRECRGDSLQWTFPQKFKVQRIKPLWWWVYRFSTLIAMGMPVLSWG